MSILVRFPLSNVTMQQYESVSNALKQSGHWPPARCLAHVCFGDEHDVGVSEVWESPEQLQSFGEALRPHLEAAGIQMQSRRSCRW